MIQDFEKRGEKSDQSDTKDSSKTDLLELFILITFFSIDKNAFVFHYKKKDYKSFYDAKICKFFLW